MEERISFVVAPALPLTGSVVLILPTGKGNC